MAPVVEALVTLVGGGQTTPPGGNHEVATREEADQLVARGFARWPKEALKAEEAAEEEVKVEDATGGEQEQSPAAAPEETAAEEAEDEDAGDEEDEGEEVADGEVQFASAAAKKLAEAEGLEAQDFEGIAPSKPNGYTKADVESAAALKRAKEIAGGAVAAEGEE